MKYLTHRIVQGLGISIEFEINNRLFTRCSMLKGVNNWRKGQLLWWKEINTGTYCNEQETEELENILKAYVFPDSFKEQLLIADANY